MVSELDDKQLATELRVTLTRLVKKLRSQSSTRNLVSLTERSVMKLLDEYQQLLPSEIAKMEKVTTQSMSQILNHLAELGYVVRMPSETDGRKVMVSLTETGKGVLEASRNELSEWLDRAIRESCSAEDKEILRKALDPLTKLVNFD